MAAQTGGGGEPTRWLERRGAAADAGAPVPLYADESLEDLQRDGLRLIQKREGFRFGEDAVALAHLAARYMQQTSPAPCRFIELGSHCGIVSILFGALMPDASGIGIELIERQVEVMQRNIALNELGERLEARQADIRGLQDEAGLLAHGLEPASFDVVLMNPPYLRVGEGPEPGGDDPSLAHEARVARFEYAVSLAEIVRTAALLLRPRGRFLCVQRPERMPELCGLLLEQRLQPECLQTIVPHAADRASLFFFASRRDGKPGGFAIESQVVVRDEEGRYTDLFAEFYGEPQAGDEGGEEDTRPLIRPGASGQEDWAEASAEAVEPGTLYIVGTPIGNLGDLSPRARSILAGVDRIACEDTRNTARLLSAIGVGRPLSAYHAHNRASREPGLVAALDGGESLALVSDAGMPAISDPGVELVRAALAAGHPIRVVPGPTAAISALAASGLDSRQFVFMGFLPRRSGERRAQLASLAEEARTVLLYEAPHRLLATLEALAALGLGTRRILLARELTKRHEEFVRLTVAEAVEHCRRVKPRGEYTLALEGAAAWRERTGETGEEAGAAEALEAWLEPPSRAAWRPRSYAAPCSRNTDSSAMRPIASPSRRRRATARRRGAGRGRTATSGLCGAEAPANRAGGSCIIRQISPPPPDPVAQCSEESRTCFVNVERRPKASGRRAAHTPPRAWTACGASCTAAGRGATCP